MNSNNKPKIITDWDSIPSNVIADGRLVSTRLLYKAHNDMKQEIEQLKLEIEQYKQHMLDQGDLLEEIETLKASK